MTLTCSMRPVNCRYPLWARVGSAFPGHGRLSAAPYAAFVPIRCPRKLSKWRESFSSGLLRWHDKASGRLPCFNSSLSVSNAGCVLAPQNKCPVHTSRANVGHGLRCWRTRWAGDRVELGQGLLFLHLSGGWKEIQLIVVIDT